MSWQDQYDLNSNRTPSYGLNFGVAVQGSEKLETDLALSIKKALATDETAPKQKHVRNTRNFEFLGDDIVQYKALILFHKTIRQGHPSVLKDAINQAGWLDTIVRNTSDYSSGPMGGSSYMPMIKAYTQYLRQKLDYHNLRPFFSGTFDYEEFVSLMGVQDPNEGFETISELLELLDKLDKFVKVIFSNVRSYGANECRIAALVPLVEESHGIYKFIVAMMTAMHMIIGSVEVLAPLRDQFKTHHYNLLKFYAECSQIRYLTSLISIPQLGRDSPDFLDQGPPQQQPKNNGISSAKKKDLEAEEAFMREQERLFQQQQEQEHLRQQEMEKQRLLQEQQELQQKQYQAELARQQQEREALFKRQQQEALQQQQQQQQFLQMQNVNQQLEWYRQQNARDRDLLGQYESRVNQMTNEMSMLRMNAEAGAKSKELENEINQWKQKYEALAKLYAQLRKEHLDLLQKFKTLKDSTGKITDESKKKVEQAEAQLKQKMNEVTDVMVERNRLQNDIELIGKNHQQELSRLQTELSQAQQALTDLSLTKGSEVQNLVNRFTKDQAVLEGLLSERQADIARLGGQLADALRDHDKLRAGFEEEKMILQAGLDQALEMLKMHQNESQSGLGQRDERIAILEGKHRDLLFQMMDNVLETCMTTVQESIYVLEGSEESRSTISPQFVLVLVEKASQKCNDFSSSFVKLVNGGDPKDAVTTGAALAQSIAQLLRNGKEMERLMPADSDDDIIDLLKNTGFSALSFFSSVKSRAISQIEELKRPEHVVNLARQTQFQIGATTEILERLATASAASKLEGDLTTAVEREMSLAAKAIEDASAKLQTLLAKGGDLNVHAAILHAAVALTTAIQYLIKCATDSQNEIVAQNKGGQTTTAFYKKNNKWTEGLISAAHSVASSTVHLVATADGLVQSTHSWEQVVVAAQDVGVSTTQLVAAARVKAAAYSKTQEKLEKAAVSVREATKLVVKAAKDASKMSAENQARQEVGRMSNHEAKVKEMEQQVRILELEKALNTARYTLGEMRKKNYHEEE